MNPHPTILAAWLAATAAIAAPTPEPAPLRDAPGRWPADRARAWAAERGWLVGCNFIPSDAINQLEMWQARTFAPATIDRELGWAESLGFNSVRVFLHDLLWRDDPDGFLDRVDRFLAIADRHGIGTMLVLFDSCWHPHPKPGRQPDPIPFTHNSGWVQAPGADALADTAQHPRLRDYVRAVTARFRADPRIHAWDLWNEPDNLDGGARRRGELDADTKRRLVRQLLPQAFAWAREANPTQPLTSGLWLGKWPDPRDVRPIERVQLENSDVISFHSYARVDDLLQCVANLRAAGRPILCTEFMARPNGSTFDPNLAALKRQGVGAYCWGFVSGKTQTIFPWDSWKNRPSAEPPLWFHDILRPDGTPHLADEVRFIRQLTGKANPTPDPQR